MNKTAIVSGSVSNTLTISESTATFSGDIPDNVGVGDAIQYESSGGGINRIAFIHARNSSTEFIVKTSTGTEPSSVTTEQTWDIFRAYSSLYDAEYGAENSGIDIAVRDFDTWSGGKDIVSSGETWNISCYGDAVDTTPVTMDGWTTDSFAYVRIYTPYRDTEVGESQRHSGVWDENKYRIEYGNFGTTNGIIKVSDENVRVEGLQIRITGANSDTFGIWFTDSNNECDIRASGNIIRAITDSSYNCVGILLWQNSYGELRLWNNIIYDFNGAGSYNEGIETDNSGFSSYIYNNTAYNCKYGYNIWPNTLSILKNNIAQNCNNGYNGAFQGSSDFNISDINGDAPNATFAGGWSTVTFVNAQDDDFHLSSIDEVAVDSGTVLSTDPNLSFIYDIDGDTRPQGAAWDIGADECTGDYLGTPGGLDFVDIFSSSVTVSWNLLNDATGYTLVCSTMSSNPPDPVWVSTTTIGVSATTATLAGLNFNTTYYFFVRSYGFGKASQYSNYLATSTLANAPSGLAVTGVFVTSTTVQWTTNNNPVNTEFEAQVSTGSSFDPVFASNMLYTSYVSTTTLFAGLSDNSSWYFRVRALNHSGVPTAWTTSVSTLTYMSGGTNYRSIGTDTSVIENSGNASINKSSNVVTFSVAISTMIGQGDMLTLNTSGNREILYILSRDDSTHVTTQGVSISTYSNVNYTITRAFNTIQNWEDARDGDLVSDNRIEVGVCYNDGPFNEQVTINASSTSASNYMHLTVAENQRHNGTAGTGVVIDRQGAAGVVVEIQSSYTKVEWLEIANWITTNCIHTSVEGRVDLGYLILHDGTGSEAVDNDSSASGNLNKYIYNSIIYNHTSDAIDAFQGGVYNVTCWNTRGIDNSLVRNCLSVGTSLRDFYNPYAGSDYNISSDDTAPGSNSFIWVDKYSLFVSTASGAEDLHLKNTADAIDTGTDTVSGLFADDIDAVVRAGNWDIGADQSPYLGKPTNVHITGIYTSSITVTWDLVGAATGYTLVASQDFDYPPINIESSTTTAGVSSTTGTVTGLQPGKLYYLFVRSNGPGDPSAYADPVTSSGTYIYRSIGTNSGTLESAGNASVNVSSNVVTFSVAISTMIGQGDKLTLDVDGTTEVVYIYSRDSDTQVTIQGLSNGHTNQDYTIERAHNTIQSWVDNRTGNLVDQRRREIGVCYNDGVFNEQVLVGAQRTDSDYFMHLTVAPGHRHNGTEGTGVRIDRAGASGTVIEINAENTLVEWLEIANWTSSNAIHTSIMGRVDLRYLILHDGTGGEAVDNDSAAAGNLNKYIYNSIIYNHGSHAVDAFQGGVYNVSCWNTSGFDNSLTKNCISVGSVLADFSNPYTGSDYNVSSDDTASGSNSITGVDMYRQYVSTGSNSINLHLADTSGAIGHGTDLSGDFTYDIDGDARGAVWDIGADQTAYLGIPQNVQVVGIYQSSMTVAWDLVGNATGYTLVASRELDNPPVDIKASSTTAGISKTTATLTGLQSDMQYYLFIRAYGGGDASAYSDAIASTATVNYRSIGTNTGILESAGNATVNVSSNIVTFSVAISTMIGQGDKLTLDVNGTPEVTYILSRDTDTQVTIQNLSSGHTGEDYQIERAFNTINDWKYNRYGNLVKQKRKESGVLYNDGVFNETVLIDGGLTDADYYYHLTVAEGHRHNGTAGTGARIDRGGAGGSYIIEIVSPYTVVEWLEMTNSASSNFIHIPITGRVDIGYLLIHNGTGGSDAIVDNDSATGNKYLYNSVIYDCNSTAVDAFGGGVYNVTAWNTNGIEDSLSLNCISMDSMSTDFRNIVAGSNYNISSDGTAVGANSITGVIDYQVFQSTVTGSVDLHIKSDSVAVNAGTDTPKGLVLYDIDGDTRPSGNYWDIGADETDSVGTPQNLNILALYRSSTTITWDLVTNATSYTLVCSTLSASPPVDIFSSSTTYGNSSTSTVLTGLWSNTTYYLFVRSHAGGQDSEYSSSVTTCTLVNIPSGLAFAGVYISSVTMQWTTNNDYANTRYEIQVSTKSNFSEVKEETILYTSEASTSTSLYELLGGATFYFRVRAVNHNDIPTDWTSSISTITLPTPIYRSVGNDSSDLNINSANLTITGTTAEFSQPLPDNVGVGDALVYAGDTKVAFISVRTDTDTFSVQSASGTIPSQVTNDSTLKIYRAFLELNDWETFTEASVNSGIPDAVDQSVIISSNIVTGNYIMNVACYAADTVDDALVTIAGWPTGSENYIRIFTPVNSSEVGESQRHNGRWDDNKYVLSVQAPSNGTMAFSIVDEFVRIDGLQIFLDEATQSKELGSCTLFSMQNTPAEIRYSNNIIKQNKGSGDSYIINSNALTDTGVVLKIWNNLIYGGAYMSIANGTVRVDRNHTMHFYNNTLIGPGGGVGVGYRIADYAYHYCKNNIVQGFSDGWNLNGSPGEPNCDYNISDVSSDAPGSHSKNDVTVKFVDAENYDFHLASSDTVAKDTGTVLGSEYAYDIDGDTRPFGTKWDIGADECTGDYLGTPAGLAFVDIFSSSATVAWTLLNDATGYNLVCSTLSTTPPVGIFASTTTSGVSATTGTLTGLWPNTTYYFFTKAYGLGQESLYSSSIATSTLADPVTSAQIYAVYYTSVTLNWAKHPATPSSSTCEGYTVQASSISDFSSIYKSTSTTDINITTLTVTGLSDDTTYWFRIGSLNWNDAANYVIVDSTMTIPFVPWS
ncbi:fibronectin type III domain-containing protein [Elusimicrobiota bacterium]